MVSSLSAAALSMMPAALREEFDLAVRTPPPRQTLRAGSSCSQAPSSDGFKGTRGCRTLCPCVCPLVVSPGD